MKRLIVDFSNLLWTTLLVGKDGENGKKIQHNGKEIYINSAQWGVDCAINNLVTCLNTLSLVPSDIIFVVETGNSKARRQAMYKAYKQNREERHPLLKENFQKAKDEILSLFGNLGATWVTQPHTEGDDVIAYLAERLDGEKIIYSTDGDLAQLLVRSDVMLWKSGTLVASNPYGDFDPTYIRVMKALVGDGNEYPGCPKFGPKKWEALLERYGRDATRYFLLREVPFGSDGDFRHAAVLRRANADLANDYGNLAQRVLSMIARNCEGRVPEPGAPGGEDEALLSAVGGLLPRLRDEMAVPAPHKALEAIWEVIGLANRWVDAQAPWTLRKTDPARMRSVLWVLAETVRQLAVLTQPFMPDASGKLLDQLAVPADARTFAALGDALAAGTALPAPQGVFPRLVEAG